MAVSTGQSIYDDFWEITGMQYTGYLSPMQANPLFERAFIQVMHDIFISGKQDTTNKDRLNSLVNTGQAINIVNNNQVYVEPLLIVAMTNVSGTNWTLTTFLPPNVLVGQTIVLNGVAGWGVNPNNNLGTAYAVTAVAGNTISFNATNSGSGSYTANSGTMIVVGAQLFYEIPVSRNFAVDYWRFLTVKAQYFTPLSYAGSYVKYMSIPLTIASATGNSVPIVITMNYYSNLRTGDQINITGVTGNTAINTTAYIKGLNDVQFALYTDKYLTTPINGNGTFTGGTIVINRVYNNYCVPYLSDDKINTLNIPKSDNPRYELANNYIKFYPNDIKVQSIILDYIRKPYQLYSSGYPIDATDNVVNLELTYPKDFLTAITNKASEIFLSELRDGSGLQLTDATAQV